MQFPTEEQIEAVISDIRSHTGGIKEGENKSEHMENCGFCAVMKEMDNRSRRAGDSVCALDDLVFKVAELDPHLTMVAATPFIGSQVTGTLLMLGRICFLVGLKTEQQKHEAEELKKMFGNLQI